MSNSSLFVLGKNAANSIGSHHGRGWKGRHVAYQTADCTSIDRYEDTVTDELAMNKQSKYRCVVEALVRINYQAH